MKVLAYTLTDEINLTSSSWLNIWLMSKTVLTSARVALNYDQNKIAS